MSTPGTPTPPLADTVYRSRLSIVTAIALSVVVGIFLIDAMIKGDLSTWLIAIPPLIAVLIAAWAFIYRPSMRMSPDALVLVGPLRRITIPYGTIHDLRVRSVISVITAKGEFSAWTGPERDRKFKGKDEAVEAAGMIRNKISGAQDPTLSAAHQPSNKPVEVEVLWIPWALCVALVALSIISAIVL